MIKDGKEYRIVDLDNDPEWPRECDSPHCINDVGYTGLLELTPRDFSKMSMAERCSLSYAERQPIQRIYCGDCIPKMFTEDEIKVLKDERREQIRRELDEWHRERVRKGYGLCM